MSSGAAAQAAHQFTKTTRRMFVRRNTPAWPFVWRGLLPSLGLAALAWFAMLPFARDWIETSVRHQTRADLDAAGFKWVELAVSGQHVVLSGQPPQPDAGQRAVALAEASSCATWAGPKPCAVDVTGLFAAPAASPTAAPAAASVATPVAAPVPALAPSIPEPLRATPQAKAPEAPASATRAAAQACEQELARLLSGTRILFASGKADIQPASRPLLDKLAIAARACPTTVRIEGHTDNVGDARLNQALSAERAASVRDALVARGLEPERLVARGFGASKPLTDNATAADRAANRRIELRPVEAN